MSGAITDLLTITKRDQAQPISVLHNDIFPSIQVLLAQESGFLTGMNAVVSQYQRESEDHVTQLKVIELVLLGLTALVLLFEGFFVFSPAVRRLSRSVADLVHAERQVAQQIEELERKNADLELAFAEAMAVHRKVMPHARVVSFGHYQVQSVFGSYYNVMSRAIEGNLMLECECVMYRRNLICTHSLAAASMHSALIRHQIRQQLPSSPQKNRGNNSSLNQGTSLGS